MIHQKELLLDISEIAYQIEEEFSSVFKPYAKGWYLRHDIVPILPAFDKSGKPITYHTKGGPIKAPWDENITEVIDPNLAESSIYNQNGDLVLSIKPILKKKSMMTVVPRYSFVQSPAIPYHGIEVITAYIRWSLDQSTTWSSLKPRLSDYLKSFFNSETLEQAEVTEVTQEITDNGKRLLPTVNRHNSLIELLIERLQYHSSELRLTVDAFTRLDEWQVYSLEHRAHIQLHLKKLGDYRILEWTRLKNEGII